ncbi:unnamed protein product [Calypogeia fissa]
MMLRTPPVKQKRSSPSSSSPLLLHAKQVHQMQTVVESKSSPTPSKRLRRPLEVGIEDPDEPFSLRSLHRGSPWGTAQQPLEHGGQHIEDLSIEPHHAARETLISDDDSEPELDWDSLRCSYKCRNLVKSDVLMSLDSREKQVIDLKATLDKLRAAYATSDEDRKKLKKTVYGLEQGLAAAKERETALYKQRTQESAKNGEQIRTHMARCAELETTLQMEMKKHAEVQERALALEARVAAAEDEKEKNLQSAIRETNKLNKELQRVEKDSEFSLARVNAELDMEKLHAQSAAAEAERLSTQLNEVQGDMAESLAERLKLEHQIFDVDIHTSSTRTTGTSEAELVIRHLKEELSQCEAELRDARKLKLKHVNADLLKERLASEKVRADRAEAELSKLSNLESMVTELETELSSWKEMIATLPGVETCNDVQTKFAELQREVVAAVAKAGESHSQMIKLQTALELAENAKQQAESAADAAQAEAVDAVLNLKRAERKALLLAKERDGLKAILASYDEEEHVIASHQKSVTGIANLATPEKAKEFRIQQLERALADSQQQIKSLGEEVEKSMKSTSDQRHKAENLSLMLAEAEERFKAIDREAGQLRSEVSMLEAKVGRGESNLSNTRVLHMIINPEAEVHGQSEAQALRLRLEMHERQFDGCRDDSPVNDGGIDKEKVTVLTQRVTALEKREARYKQVFANKISVFREACGLIFGYKVQMNEEQDPSTGSSITLFTLRSIYSTSEEEQIQFQFKAGTLEMIANDYVSSPELQRQVNTFVRNYKSIPAFIANLTMEQFNKTTLG